MEAQDQAVAQACEADEVDEAETPAGAEARKQAAQLESQDDLGYVTGEHDPKQADKQVRTPAPRRQPGKAKEGGGDQN